MRPKFKDWNSKISVISQPMKFTLYRMIPDEGKMLDFTISGHVTEMRSKIKNAIRTIHFHIKFN